MERRLQVILSTLSLCCLLCGCVQRRMAIRSDPPGALVMIDGEDVGYTPTSVDFTYYGTREIRLIKPGFRTLTTMTEVPAPWYQKVPFDFFSDNLLPYQVTNRHNYSFQLSPQEVTSTEDLLKRAGQLRSEAQLGQ